MPSPSREQSQFRERTYAYSLSADELETMYDVGRFRVIATEDLARQRYAGRYAEMRQDLRSLLSQGLVIRRKLHVGVKKEELTVLALKRREKHARRQLLTGGIASRFKGSISALMENRAILTTLMAAAGGVIAVRRLP